jgi:hypothetical protein
MHPSHGQEHYGLYTANLKTGVFMRNEEQDVVFYGNKKVGFVDADGQIDDAQNQEGIPLAHTPNSPIFLSG